MSGVRLGEKSYQRLDYSIGKHAQGEHYNHGELIYTTDSEGRVSIYVFFGYSSSDSDLSYAYELYSQGPTYRNSFSEINSRLTSIALSLDSDIHNGQADWAPLRSDIIKWAANPLYFEVRKALDYQYVDFIESKPIITAGDSCEDGHTLVWDSDTQDFIYRIPLLSLNGVKADTNSNVGIAMAKILSGPFKNRPVSDSVGMIYIVEGDSDTTLNFTSYVYDTITNKWYDITTQPPAIDFLRADSDEMTGPLVFDSDYSVANFSAVTRRYVLRTLFQDERFQDRIKMFNATAHEANIATDEVFVTGSFLKKGPTNIVSTYLNDDIQMDDGIEKILDGSMSGNDISFTTQNFTDDMVGSMNVYVNGTLQSFTRSTNLVNTTNDMRHVPYQYSLPTNGIVLSTTQQAFTITINTTITLSDLIICEYISHNGLKSILTKDAGSNIFRTDDVVTLDFGLF